MAVVKVCAVLAMMAACIGATPAPTTSSFNSLLGVTNIEEMRSMCNNDDALACIKYKTVSFLEGIFNQDQYQVTEDITVTKNTHLNNQVASSARGDASLEERVQDYLQGHDITIKVPVVDSTVTIGARNLDQNEIDLKVNFGSNQAEARKSKLKKILIPIIVLVLLKAITLIPLALGILGLKAWNALQLSFFSFVVSIGLAVFQLCKKIASDSAHPAITAHTPWDVGTHYAARSLDAQAADAQPLAYSAYL